MKMKFQSLDALFSGCSSSRLMSCFPRSLALNRSVNLELVSGSMDSEGCRAEFVAHPVDGSIPIHVDWNSSPRGERGHMELLLYA